MSINGEGLTFIEGNASSVYWMDSVRVACAPGMEFNAWEHSGIPDLLLHCVEGGTWEGAYRAPFCQGKQTAKMSYLNC